MDEQLLLLSSLSLLNILLLNMILFNSLLLLLLLLLLSFLLLLLFHVCKTYTTGESSTMLSFIQVVTITVPLNSLAVVCLVCKASSGGW